MKPKKVEAEGYRNRLHQAFQDHYGFPSQDGTDLQRGTAMLKFFVERILMELDPGSLPTDEEDVEKCYVDGKSDLRVDFLCRHDGVVTLIQSKYRKRGSPESETDFDSFAESLSRLHPKAGKGYQPSAALRDACADIDWDEDHFQLFFVTLGTATPGIRARAKVGIASIDGVDDLPSRATLEFYDESDLNQKLQEALRATEQISTATVLLAKEQDGASWLRYVGASGKKSYIGRIAATQLFELYKQHKTRLFESNIRNWLGENSINKQLVETAKMQPSDFFYFNNGVSAIASNIVEDKKNSSLICERLSIVNGAQTTRSLHLAFGRDPDAVRGAHVLIRITEVSYQRTPQEEAFLRSITRYNNVQSVVKAADFRSNDGIQLAMRDHFDRLDARAGKKFSYQNKRSGDRRPNRILVPLEEFTKSIYSFRYAPFDAHGGTAHLFDPGESGGYAKVFGDGQHVWSDVDPDGFRLLAGTWLLLERVRDVLKSLKAQERYLPFARSALERRWLVYFIVGEFLRESYKYRGQALLLDNHLRGLCKHASMQGETSTSSAIQIVTKASADVLILDYKGESDRSGFSQRNWYRDPSTAKRLRDLVSSQSIILEAIRPLS